MYEMATGRLPFDGQSAVAVALKHLNDPLPDMNILNTGLSESIVRIIKKATEKSSTRRYQTVADMDNDLRRALNDTSGSFVQINPMLGDSPTRKISKEEQEEIKRETRRIEESYEFMEDDEYYDDEDEYYDDEDYDEDYYKPLNEKKKERMVIFSAIATALVLIGFITWGLYYFYSQQTPEMIRVPDLYGMNMESARGLVINELGLALLAMDDVYDELDAGLIVSQAEYPDELLEKGSTIHVVLSLGPNLITIPDFSSVSATLEDAQDILSVLDIILTIEMVDEEGYPTGVVVRQEPEGLSRVAPGTEVTLYISEGPDQTMSVVPFLLGKNEAEAIELLTEAGLTIGLSLKAESTTYSKDIVCRQSIDPDERVERGTEIVYTLSLGAPMPPPDPVPQITPNDPPPETVTQRVAQLYIALWDVSPETESVHVVVVTSEGNNPPVEFFRSGVPVSGFPLPLEIPVTGPTDVMVYSIEEYGDMVLRYHTPLFND
jgi:serine/threonine-protein kinase